MYPLFPFSAVPREIGRFHLEGHRHIQQDLLGQYQGENERQIADVLELPLTPSYMLSPA